MASRSQEEIRRKRKKKRLRQRRRKLICKMLFILVVLVIGVRFGTGIVSAVLQEHGYLSNGSNVDVPAPQMRDDTEVEESIAAMATTDAAYQNIYDHRDEYPQDLLMMLVNNPEMLDFVSGYLTADPSTVGSIASKEKPDDNPLFLQWDKRWGYANYGSADIAISGCGPTCLSMVIYALTGDESATPYAIAQYSQNNGYYIEGTGTKWSLMTDAPTAYGVKVEELSLAQSVMERTLDAGGKIICAMAPGDFTTAGHFIEIYDYDEKGFYVNDPNCISRSQKQWSYDTLSTQIKNLWGYTF